MTQPSELINRLEQLRDREDRARLASLRRGLGQPLGAIAETSRVIEHMLAENDPPWVAETLYVIGPLFALQQKPFSGDRWSNMGDHFRSLYAENEEPPTNVERRFMALLASEPDDLSDALRQAITLLKSKDVPVNWLQLFYDVQAWLDRRDEGEQKRIDVRQKWSRCFWRLSSHPTPEEKSQPTPDSEQ